MTVNNAGSSLLVYWFLVSHDHFNNTSSSEQQVLAYVIYLQRKEELQNKLLLTLFLDNGHDITYKKEVKDISQYFVAIRNPETQDLIPQMRL